jgi:integrase
MRFLSPVEVRRLADAIGPRFRALVFLGAYCGLRIGELAGLRHKQVDLLNGVVHIAEVVTEMHGHLYPGPPRPGPADTLSACLESRSNPYASTWPPDPMIQTRSCSARPTAVRFAPRASALASGVRRPGPPAWRVLASMTFGIPLWLCGIAAGANLKEVAVRAGHTSVSFTLDRYDHLYPAADVALRDRLDQLHEGAGETQMGE